MPLGGAEDVVQGDEDESQESAEASGAEES